MSVTFESYERRIDKINKTLAEYGIKDLEDARRICLEKGVDAEAIVRGIQPIAFENAVWAYTVGAAIAIKKGCTKAADAAAALGIGLQSFCIPGSVADQRKVGLVTNPSRRRKALSVSQKRQTKSERPRSKSF